MAIHLAMKAQEKESAVLFMDLNNFKPVNDAYGHDVGDEVMRSYFQTVLNLAEADDVYGWGGDEVVVFLRETDETTVEARVAAIKKAVAAECSAQPVLAQDSHRISVACGAYVFASRESPAAIVEAADRRMYEDKARMKANAET